MLDRLSRPLAVALAVTACAADPAPSTPLLADPDTSGLRLVGARAPGGAPVELWLRGRHLADPARAGPDVPERDLTGRFVVPGIIDAHTHLAYVDRAYDVDARCGAGAEDCTAQEALLRAGVIAAVDLAAPLSTLPQTGPLRVRSAGPMLTPPGGYPLSSWGRGGFGLEVDDPDDARDAVARLQAAGAQWIKIPLGPGRWLAPEVAEAAVTEAHRRGLRVAVHAPSVAALEAAIALDVDLLAHSPVEPIPDDLAAAWGTRAVASTLSTFSRGSGAADNLRILADAGARVLYGTDLGNGNAPGISAPELRALVEAGFTAEQVLDAATRSPAEYFGFEELGALEVGKAACVLVLEADPLEDIGALAAPVEIIGAGCPRL